MCNIGIKIQAIDDEWVIVYPVRSTTKAALPFSLGGTCCCHCCQGAIGMGGSC